MNSAPSCCHFTYLGVEVLLTNGIVLTFDTIFVGSGDERHLLDRLCTVWLGCMLA